MEWVNIIIQGVLIGGLYAMFAAGLALIFGVMRLVNIAHGDLIVLAAYVALMTTDTLGLNPLLAIAIVAPIVIRDIYQALPRIKAGGTSIILVEQDIVQAMKVADRVYCFQEGRVSLFGSPSKLTREQIHAAYFGT